MKSSRRKFIRSLLGITALLPMASIARASSHSKGRPLQTSPVAGFQYYSGEQLWPRLREGSPVMLKRETDNRYDKHAIAVTWNGQKLGYLPRAQNYTLSQMMDRGEQLTAHIEKMKNSVNAWNRIRVKVKLND